MFTLKITVVLVLIGAFLLCAALAGAVWALRVRPFVEERGRRGGPLREQAGPVANFLAMLEDPRARRRAPWFVKLFPLLIAIAAADLILIALLLAFGVR